MKLFKPQLLLVKVTDVINPDKYYLHVTTYTDKTNYREDGYTIGSISNGVLDVTVEATQEQHIKEFESMTPIVHTIDLGSPAFPGGDGIIEVTFDDGTSGTGNERKNFVRTVDADEDSRPIG